MTLVLSAIFSCKTNESEDGNIRLTFSKVFYAPKGGNESSVKNQVNVGMPLFT